MFPIDFGIWILGSKSLVLFGQGIGYSLIGRSMSLGMRFKSLKL